MWHIVGLGNYGSQYINNAHNIGFKTLDALLLLLNGKYSRSNNAFYYITKIDDVDIKLIKFKTYMNLTGHYIQSSFSPLIIIHDEIDLPINKIKIKYGGSDNGHNGLKSITNKIGNDYYRIRIGIGKRYPIDKYVLSDIDIDDEIINKAANSVINIVRFGLEYAQNSL